MAVQTGVTLARAEVLWFNHNDMADLGAHLQSLGEVYAKCKHRVFLVVEGLYASSGHVLDLNKIMKLKETYPFRIILEESYSIGVLGKTGRGITQHCNVPASQVEIICGSLGHSFGGVGGFAVGTKEICDHMRLNCSGYVFSCSLPPYISTACLEAAEIMKDGKDVAELQKKSQDTLQMSFWLKETCQHFFGRFSLGSFATYNFDWLQKFRRPTPGRNCYRNAD